MAAEYPGAVPTIAANKADGTSTATDHAAHHNKLAEEVVAIATELGTNPSGAEATVAAAIAALAARGNITQTEIDFGATPIYAKSFVVTDAGVSGTSQIIPTVARDAATAKDADEAEMDALKLVASPGAGNFTLYAEGLEGRVYGAFKINYLVG